MILNSREFVLNNDTKEINTSLSRTNEMFKQNTQEQNAFGVDVASPEISEPSRSRRLNLFGGRSETVDPRPSQETLTQLAVSMPETRQEAKIEMSSMVEPSKGISLTRQNKVFIACFLVAIVALSFFMVIGAINLKNSSTLINAQQTSIENAQNEITRLENEINSINGTELQARASQLGYSQVTEANSYSLLALSDNTIPVSTNWFDSLCNFVSSIIG